MPRNKRVFPFFLDGGIQEMTFTSGESQDWNGTSSYIEVQGTNTGTVSIGKVDSYGRPIPHGTMLLVRKVDADNTTFTVDWTDEFTDGNGGTAATLRNLRDAVLLLFKGPSETNDKGEWVNLTADTSENNVYGALTVGNTFTTNAAANLNGTTSFVGVAKVQNQIRKENDGTITAADGTNAATAATLGSIDHPVYFVSSDGATKGVKLDASPPDTTTITLINTSGTAMKLYPDGATRTTINGAASIDLAANAVVTVYYATGAVYVG